MKVLVGEGKDKFGNNCTIYFQYNPQNGQPETERIYPDRNKVVGIAEEILSRSAFEETRKNTQMAVNNDGSSRKRFRSEAEKEHNEATKNVKESLQRGQTAPKTITSSRSRGHRIALPRKRGRNRKVPKSERCHHH